MLEKMYSPEEVAALTGVCRKTILRRIKDGAIPDSVKISSNSVRIPESSVQRFLSERKSGEVQI